MRTMQPRRPQPTKREVGRGKRGGEEIAAHTHTGHVGGHGSSNPFGMKSDRELPVAHGRAAAAGWGAVLQGGHEAQTTRSPVTKEPSVRECSQPPLQPFRAHTTH